MFRNSFAFSQTQETHFGRQIAQSIEKIVRNERTMEDIRNNKTSQTHENITKHVKKEKQTWKSEKIQLYQWHTL